MPNSFAGTRMSSDQVTLLMRRINALEHEARLHYVDYMGFYGNPHSPFAFQSYFGRDGLIYQVQTHPNGFLMPYAPNDVSVFNLDNVQVRQFSVTPTLGIRNPHIDATGGMYFALDRGVQKYSATSGTLLWTQNSVVPQSNKNYAIAVSPAGDVFFAKGRTIYALDGLTGTTQTSWVVTPVDTYERVCYAMDYEDATDTLWVWVWSEHKIKGYGANGTLKVALDLPSTAAALQTETQYGYTDPGAWEDYSANEQHIYKPWLRVDARRVFAAGRAEFVSVSQSAPMEHVGPYNLNQNTSETEPVVSPLVSPITQAGTLWGDYLLLSHGHMYRLGRMGETRWRAPNDPPLEKSVLPDHGVQSPAINLYANTRTTAQVIFDLRDAIMHALLGRLYKDPPMEFPAGFSASAPNLWLTRPLWRYFVNAATGRLFNWTENDDANNAYRVAMGDRSDYGGAGPAYDWTETYAEDPETHESDWRTYDINIGEPYEIVGLLEGSSLHYEMDE